VVSGNAEQGPGCQREENKNLHPVEEVVERGDKREEKRIRATEEEVKEVIGGGTHKSETTVVDWTVQDPHVERVPAEPLGGRGLAGTNVCQPSSRSHCRSVDRQSGKASKHHGRKGENAQSRVLPDARWRLVLRVTSSRPSP